MRPSVDARGVLPPLGLDPATPFLLYVCSSEFVAPREVEFVSSGSATCVRRSNPAVRSCGVLVRPHPAHLKQWKDVNLAAFPNVGALAREGNDECRSGAVRFAASLPAPSSA